MSAGGEEAAHEPDTRFVLANERTFLAWSRTSLALVIAGAAIGQVVDRIGAVPSVLIGGLLAAMGVGAALLGLRRWRQVESALREDRPPPRAEGIVYLAHGLAIVAAVTTVALVSGGVG